ncbi:uncharacterized protein BDZ99DRAFT_515381 [Mytilinidion resinicola]|uniref:Uncharacterized protein n=1 Tax=Mytilinidion resinicola TaxID=574789 RepID=A0A6A6Z086_9PEZI|nr:uncharacterized protein BDZ99DRAFT_515381 [Mytilinidion resinicola]KAF2814596.1 hypothetical protein BDZ99DRAFT_515381 [Mytilinidion resinicola]
MLLEGDVVLPEGDVVEAALELQGEGILAPAEKTLVGDGASEDTGDAVEQGTFIIPPLDEELVVGGRATVELVSDETTPPRDVTVELPVDEVETLDVLVDALIRDDESGFPAIVDSDEELDITAAELGLLEKVEDIVEITEDAVVETPSAGEPPDPLREDDIDGVVTDAEAEVGESLLGDGNATEVELGAMSEDSEGEDGNEADGKLGATGEDVGASDDELELNALLAAQAPVDDDPAGFEDGTLAETEPLLLMLADGDGGKLLEEFPGASDVRVDDDPAGFEDGRAVEMETLLLMLADGEVRPLGPLVESVPGSEAGELLGEVEPPGPLDRLLADSEAADVLGELSGGELGELLGELLGEVGPPGPPDELLGRSEAAELLGEVGPLDAPEELLAGVEAGGLLGETGPPGSLDELLGRGEAAELLGKVGPLGMLEGLLAGGEVGELFGETRPPGPLDELLVGGKADEALGESASGDVGELLGGVEPPDRLGGLLAGGGAGEAGVLLGKAGPPGPLNGLLPAGEADEVFDKFAGGDVGRLLREVELPGPLDELLPESEADGLFGEVGPPGRLNEPLGGGEASELLEDTGPPGTLVGLLEMVDGVFPGKLTALELLEVGDTDSALEDMVPDTVVIVVVITIGRLVALAVVGIELDEGSPTFVKNAAGL